MSQKHLTFITIVCSTLWAQDMPARRGRGGSARPPLAAGRRDLHPDAVNQTTNVIRPFAGTSWLFSGGGQLAAQVPLGFSDFGILDSNNNLIFSDRQNHMVFKIGSDGIIQVIAGNGLPGFSGDGGLAVQAQLNEPGGIALDSSGNLFIVDSGNLRIRRVD